MTNSSVEANRSDDNILLPVMSPITAAVIGALWPASALMRGTVAGIGAYGAR
jgi:hypothetical protein